MKRIALIAILTALASQACAVQADDASPASEAPSATSAYAFDPSLCAGRWHVDRATFAANAPDALRGLDAAPDALARFTGRPGAVTLDDHPEASCTIRALTSADVASWDEHTVGEYDSTSGNITIVVSRMPACDGAPSWDYMACAGPLILHEMLHGLGMSHIADTDRGIMNAHTMAPYFTTADHDLCVRETVCVNGATWTPRQ